MNGIPVIIDLLQGVRFNMHTGKSVSFSVASALKPRVDPFSKSLKVWLYRFEAGQKQNQLTQGLPEITKTTGRQTLTMVLERGLEGAPIDEVLSELEKELYSLAENQYEKYLQLLPMKMMMPLLALILPGVLLLLIGPLLFTVEHGF